jgi:membrane protease YdiL (CAAX protease family)
VLRFVATLLPGFGEEFGWRGYLLPRLAQRYSPRRAVLVHSFITWAWHLPVIVGMGMLTAGNAGAVGLTIAIALFVSLIPAKMNAVIFAYLWTGTQSLAVVSVYHSAYDEMRDTLVATIGLGPLASPWEGIVGMLLGAVLLWKGNWKQLTCYRSTHEELQEGGR